MGLSRFPKYGDFGRLQTHVGYLQRQSRHLSCREARVRVDQTFRTLFDNHDDLQYKVRQRMMKGEYEWLEGSLVQPIVPTVEQAEEAIRKLA